MVRFTLAISLLLALGTGVSAECEACPNCDYENISIQQGDACLNYWTCSGDTISCYYPSVANPGTWNTCSYAPANVSNCLSQQCMHTHLGFGNARIGHSYLAPAISVSHMRESTRNVNLGMTLTTLASQAAPLHMGLSMKATVSCYRVNESRS